MSLEKLLFQIWESFRLRKNVGCLSVDCMAWMYSSSVRFSFVKKSSKLINSSKSHCSRNANKDLKFPMTTLSSKLIGSMILVVLIGGTGKLYLQCEFFSFFYSFLYDNVYELWQVLDPNDLCCMLCICPQITRSVNCCQLHRLVHPLSTTVRGHVHFPYYGIQSQKSSPIFFRKTFHHDISIVSKHLFHVYSSEYMSLGLFL